jgi:hypothetical protein
VAKKKRGLKKFRERANERRSSPSFLPNPATAMALLEEVGPAFGGYVAGRFASRVALKVGAAKMGKHAAPAAATIVALLTWLLAGKWKKIAKYHSPLVVGTTIAAIQTIVQAYLPKYAWLISDASPADYLPKPAAAPAGMSGYSSRRKGLRPVGDEFDALEQQAMRNHPVEDEFDHGPPISDAQAMGGGGGGGAVAPDLDPNDFELDDSGGEDYGSLGGGMAN